MKKLSFINKVLFIINNVFALLLIFSFLTPYIKPSTASIISLFSLITPLLIIVNLIFIIFWVLAGFKKYFLLSLFTLLISFIFQSPLYKLSSKTKNENNNKLSIMSYNVRKFNMYGWIDDSKIPQKISQYIENESPDVVALQEYRENSNFKLNYPYYSNPLVNNYSDPVENAKHRTSYAVFSKYPIINTGLFKDKRYKVNAIYTDILKERDTIRIVNYHLYSLGVVAEKNYNYSDSKSLLKGLSNSFKHQVEQVDLLNSIIKKTTYKTIIVGDMNNTAYSWAYKNLKSDFKDTFTEAGEKFGKTYSFKGLPLRIDYIFVDTRFEVTEHKNYNVKYSDHYPIMATISF